VCSVGNVTEDAVAAYIERQDVEHQDDEFKMSET